MHSLDETIRTLKQHQLSRERLQWMLARAQTLLKDNRAEVRRRRDRLEKERADVERLEGKTLTALLCWAFSSKESQLRKEREEALRARVRFEEARDAGSTLLVQIDDLEGRLLGLDDVTSQLAAAFEAKEATLKKSGGAAAERLFGIAEERAMALAAIDEINEAAAEGQRADQAVVLVLKSLEGASSWGVWDMMGGGMISTAMKHSNIDESRRHARKAQDQLQRFSRELGDVDQATPFMLEVGGFLGFADYFMDNLLVDYAVQSKINRARDSTAGLRRDIKKALEDLVRRKRQANMALEALDIERRALLEETGAEPA